MSEVLESLAFFLGMGLCLLITIGGLVFLVKILDRSRLERKYQSLLDESTEIYHKMLNPEDLDSADFLTEETRTRIHNWLEQQRKVTRNNAIDD